MTQALRIFDRNNRDVTDNFDEDGILKDKRSVRVPLTMKDSDGNVVDTKRRKGTQFDPNGLISHTWKRPRKRTAHQRCKTRSTTCPLPKRNSMRKFATALASKSKRGKNASTRKPTSGETSRARTRSNVRSQSARRSRLSRHNGGTSRKRQQAI